MQNKTGPLKVLFAEKTTETEKYRIAPELFEPKDVYGFLESLDSLTRSFGMRIIKENPRFSIPEELFRLSESPDRKVKTFLVRSIWNYFRDKGTTEHWNPTPLPEKQAVRHAKQFKELNEEEVIGLGSQNRPENLPASFESLNEFLRCILFNVPPAKLPKRQEGEIAFETAKFMPARKSKLALIDAARDLAVEDVEFAKILTPLFLEFLDSRGKSEKEACLVATTRIKVAHPELSIV